MEKHRMPQNNEKSKVQGKGTQTPDSEYRHCNGISIETLDIGALLPTSHKVKGLSGLNRVNLCLTSLLGAGE